MFAGLEWKDRFSRGQEQKSRVPGRRSSKTIDTDFCNEKQFRGVPEGMGLGV